MTRSDNIPPEQRLIDLISGYFDQTLTPAERDELERRLISSTAARSLYWDVARMHGLAREWGLAADASAIAEQLSGRPARRRRAWWVSAAAVLVVGLLVAAWAAQRAAMPPANPSAQSMPSNLQSGSFAVVADADDTVWATPGVIPAAGNRVGPSFLILQAGSARFAFDSGAEVLVDAPAEISLVSRDEVRLHSGRLLVHAPSAARGFTVHAGTLSIVDQGTEFGVLASTDRPTEVHVFNGTVDVDPTMGSRLPLRLQGGQATRWKDGATTAITASRAGFPSAARFASARQQDRERLEAWRMASKQLSSSPGVAIHYRFDEKVVSGAVVRNDAASSLAVGAVAEGVTAAAGRWAGQPAVQFSRRTDRIRMLIPGTYNALTLATWVRLDGLPNAFNSLLRADNASKGAVHWHIDRSGRLRFGFVTGFTEFVSPDTGAPTDWDVAVAPPLLTDRLGQWVFLATVYDSKTGLAIHYNDGSEVARHTLKYPLPVHFGKAMLGNGADPGDKRSESSEGALNLSGRMGEFLFANRAMSAEEIGKIYEQGKPAQ